MADERNRVLENLRIIRADCADTKDDIREVKNRITKLESGQATLLEYVAHLAGDGAEQNARYDRLLERIERIERRLQLRESDDAWAATELQR